MQTISLSQIVFLEVSLVFPADFSMSLLIAQKYCICEILLSRNKYLHNSRHIYDNAAAIFDLLVTKSQRFGIL